MANLVKLQTAGRSVKNKLLPVADVVISRDIDILALTETWLSSVIDDLVISALVPRVYGFHAVSPPGGKHGNGVAVLYKSGLTLKKTSTRESHFEQSDYYIRASSVIFMLCVACRPPPSKQNDNTDTTKCL